MKNKRIILLDLAGPYFPGGCEKYFSDLAHFFSQHNSVLFLYSSLYITCMDYVYLLLWKRKIGTTKQIKRNIGKSVTVNLSLRRIVMFWEMRNRLVSADVVYAKNEFQELLFLYLILGKRLYKEKVVVGVHSAIFLPDHTKGVWTNIHNLQYKSRFYKTFLKNARTIHVINKDDVQKISNEYVIDPKKIIYIPHAINWQSFLKNQNQKKFTISWAGRLTYQKGLDYLSVILRLLSKKDEFTDMQVLIAGKGEELQKILELEKKYKNIHYLGYLKNMGKLYGSSDLAIVTSNFETFGYNVLEPQSFGVPVISCNIPGPRDIILHGKTGYLVENEEEFVEKILFYYHKRMSNKKGYLTLTKQIQARTQERFSQEKILQELNKMLLL